MDKRTSVLLSAMLLPVSVGVSGCGDQPDPVMSAPVAGWNEPVASLRRAAANAAAKGDLPAVARALPVLVEYLDDEAPEVAEAAQRAILRAANLGAPIVLRHLSEVPIVDGDGGMADIVRGLGRAFTDTDIAIGLTKGTPADRRVAWVAAATVFKEVGEDEGFTRMRLRMASLEAEAGPAEDRELASAAAALIAYRIASFRDPSGGPARPLLSVVGRLPTLVSALEDTKTRTRAVLAAHFVAATGAGDATTVASLASQLSLASKPPPNPAGPLDIGGGGDAALLALAGLSSSHPAATTVLDGLSDDEFDAYADEMGGSDRGAYLARRAVASSSPARLRWAVGAVQHGSRRPELGPILVEAATRETTRSALGLDLPALLALGQFGPLAKEAIGPLEKLLAKRRLDVPARMHLSAALLGVRPGHAATQEVLLEDVFAPARTTNQMELRQWHDRRWSAIVALARSGTGPLVAELLAKTVAPDPGAPEPEASLVEYAMLEECTRGLGRLAGDAGPQGLRALLARLEAKIPGEEQQETAAVVEARAAVPGMSYRQRSAALRAIGSYGAAARDQRARLVPFLTAPDPRLSVLAAQALRRIDASVSIK